MTTSRTIAEILRALCVLALLFLNFAHQPVAVQAASGDVLSIATTLGFCGTPPGDDKSNHAPCHACRIGIADLPAPAQVPLGPCAVTAFTYGALPVLSLPARYIGPQTARGPPVLS